MNIPEGKSYDLNRPWETLDDWQKEYIKTPWYQDCFLLSTRQGGKTTAMSIKAVEMCINDFGKGEVVLISSLTERQAQLMLAKAQIYAEEKYPKEIAKGRDKPTMHKLLFKNGSGILCYAAGEEGDSTRGYTLKKLMVDEGSRMDELYFISATPTLSVSKGSMDIASTPHGKKDKEGNETFFYKASKDEHYKKWYVSAEDCPRHSPEFLAREKERMSKLQYAQEYLAQFLDELHRVFSDEQIKEICVLERRENLLPNRKYYLGCDIAGFGTDENTFESFDGTNKNKIEQVGHEISKHKFTTETAEKIKLLNISYNYKQIGIDDGGVGFGVYSELMNNYKTKRKTFALNNASRQTDSEGKKSKKLLKEEMYINLLMLVENHRIKLLKDDEIKAALAFVQFEEGNKIIGSHIAEGIIRACWLCVQDKSLNMFVHSY
ncbi:MAG: hypothetical protein M0R35_07120 [Candidatus Omnitrophica bacterium]|nr:hypothetical protein [Candidatus Omnitrophota bacterium]